jgi:DNA (cytosine-5)-methyltransferase 1
MTTLTVGSLFAGIGGIELGLEWTGGFRTVWQVERDEYCRKVLARHWPKAQRFDDVRTVGAHNLTPVDVITFGFPCQDVSWANADGDGLDGERSGLYREAIRIIRELRPEYAVMENVSALLARGFGAVLGDLADSGYDAEWSCVSACAVGAPHMRQRVFLVAYSDREHGRSRVWDTAPRTIGALPPIHGAPRSRSGWRARLANPSALYGGADGVPFGSQRNRAIGNAVVPRVAEVIGERLLTIHAALQGAA